MASLFGGVTIPGAPDLENVRKLDRLPIPILRKMSRYGMAIDREYLSDLGSQFRIELNQLERDIASYIPADRLHEFSTRSAEIEEEEGSILLNVGSSEQVGKLLFDMLALGSGMTLKMTKAGDRLSTGKRQLELLRMKHEVVPLLLRYRELDKLVTTYCNKLPKLAVFHPHGKCCPVCELDHISPSWRVHGELGTTRAATGRINHKNPNLANVPTRTDDGQAVQAGFVATEGHVIVARDMSQIELRCLAHLANEQKMLGIYAEDGDIHDLTARMIFKLAANEKPDKIKHRMASKRAIFSVQNGSTEKGLYLQLVMDYGQSKILVPDWLTLEWCAWFLTELMNTYADIQAWFEQQWYRARRYGMTWTLFGRTRLIPEVQSVHSWIKQAGLRQAQNLPITGTAADQLRLSLGQADETLTELYEAGVWNWPLMTIHDSLMVEVVRGREDVVNEAMQYAMDTVMTDRETGEHCFRVLIKSDGDTMTRWVK